MSFGRQGIGTASEHVAVALLAAFAATKCFGGVTLYTGAAGWQSWQQAATGFTTLDFTDLEEGENVASDRYASYGVLLTDFDLNEGMTNPLYFLQDGHGLEGHCELEFTFTAPMQAASLHFPGGTQAWLYSGNTLLAFVNNAGFSGANNFLGFTSNNPFDRLVLKRFSPPPPFPCDEIEIDNLYFSTVPSPSAAAILSLGILGRSRRRR
jgi:hypothetical protein